MKEMPGTQGLHPTQGLPRYGCVARALLGPRRQQGMNEQGQSREEGQKTVTGVHW
jgi:hypothetical protein